MKYYIKDLGTFDSEKDGLINIKECSDGFFKEGKDGVLGVYATGDRKVEFITFKDRSIAYVLSSIGYPAYYPIKPIKLEAPIKAVLMDLDGTSVKSEEFWVYIIEKTVQSLLNDNTFKFSKEDLPYVSGHSVSEHLQYCIEKYAPNATLEKARELYFKHTHYEMNEIMEGRGKEGAFTPSKHLKEFLMGLKQLNVKIGLVTSGLYEKAWPEILSAFNTLKMGDPKEFYDASISAGFAMRKGSVGTLGELEPKPHPWLYAETATVGLNIPESERNHVIGIEDSGAGVCSIVLAGFTCIGYDGGNIISSGTKGLCSYYFNDLLDILDFIKKVNQK